MFYKCNLNEKYIKHISKIMKIPLLYNIYISIFTNLVKIFKKNKKSLKVGSVQPDLDQTLSKFCYHDYQIDFKARGALVSK